MSILLRTSSSLLKTKFGISSFVYGFFSLLASSEDFQWWLVSSTICFSRLQIKGKSRASGAISRRICPCHSMRAEIKHLFVQFKLYTHDLRKIENSIGRLPSGIRVRLTDLFTFPIAFVCFFAIQGIEYAWNCHVYI